MRRLLTLLGLTAVAALFGAVGTEPVAAAARSSDAIVEQAAREHGVPASRLRLADHFTQRYALTGVTLDVAKAYDRQTGRAYLVATDERGGAAEPKQVQRAETTRRYLRYGKLEPRLGARLRGASASRAIPVSIWLNVPDPPLRRDAARGGMTAQGARAALAGRLAAARLWMAPRRRLVVDAIRRMGARAETPTYAPAVFARLRPAQIRKLAQYSDVVTVYGPERYGQSNDDMSTTERVWPVWQQFGNQGKVGTSAPSPVVHEDTGVADSNPFLKNATHSVSFFCAVASASCPAGKNVSDHASMVAGVIASTSKQFRGMAPRVGQILSANFQDFSSDARKVEAFEWALANGGNPTNMSWGTFCGGFQTFSSRYVDWAVKNLRATFVIAAGNHPSGCSTGANDDRKVNSPALAWSVISVGSQFDNDNGWWSDDGQSSFSDFVNPDFAPGMEKPEVDAVGENVRSTDAQGGDHFGQNSGTSFASPSVAGAVSLMLARRPGQTEWPETNKAAILTSAYHDVVVGKGQDGVGSVVINNAERTYALDRFANDCLAPDCTPLTAADFPRTYSFSLNQGQKFRAAVAWDSLSTGGDGTDTLGGDLDLCVYEPGGSSPLACSTSAQNAWEMVEATAPSTGTYTAQVTLVSSEPGWDTFLGFAYSVKSIPTFCTTAPLKAPGTYPLDTTTGPTFFDTYAGFGGDAKGRERAIKFQLSDTSDITVSDTSGSTNVHVLQISDCAADPITPTVLANGTSSAFVNDAPAGTYYAVLDSPSRGETNTSLTIGLSGP